MGALYADVIVDITHERLDRTFQYKIPEELEGRVQVGSQVEIPFGNGNRQIRGYVIAVGAQSRFDPARTKEILSVDGGALTVESKLIALAGWMKRTYGSTMIQALKTVIPVRKKIREKEERRILLAISAEAAKKKLEEYEKKHQKARARVLEGLLEQEQVPYSQALSEWKVTAAVLRGMEQQGVLTLVSRTVYRNPIEGMEREREELELTQEQAETVRAIRLEWEQSDRPCLLQGVTGSGKTVVYMELIEQVLREGKQAILLIPEISLTYQNIRRFCSRFGEQVTVMHSRMSQAERCDQMERARQGQVRIMIGPRSALFTPFPALGLIILDEEHEGSYKSETTPRYHARETAVCRAQLEGAHLVLGSATPSVEAAYRSAQGRYARFLLNSRYRASQLPQIYAVDMREELRQGNRSILSRRLQEAMEERLRRKEQTMLFLNRRGYAGFVSCRSCGYVVKCPHCDVALTAHNGGRLVCHYCGYTAAETGRCPSCGSSYIGGFRAGTQQIEQVVKKRFPAARVMRMDLDTTRGKEGYQKILEAFGRKEADILVGTQMIVKGHDFPDVTLMGVLAADLSLYASDYRAAERTYQLLVQAAGRSGRSGKAGEAVIQTYHPEHYSIQAAVRQDYEAFYREEISYRSLLGYPPVSCMLAIHGACADEGRLEQAMEYVHKYLMRVRRDEQVQLIGPAAECVAKISDMYRSVLYVRGPGEEELVRMREKLERYVEINRGFDTVYLQFDMNA